MSTEIWQESNYRFTRYCAEKKLSRQHQRRRQRDPHQNQYDTLPVGRGDIKLQEEKRRKNCRQEVASTGSETFQKRKPFAKQRIYSLFESNS